MRVKKYDKFSYPQQGNSVQQRSAVRTTHSYLMKWSSEKMKFEQFELTYSYANPIYTNL